MWQLKMSGREGEHTHESIFISFSPFFGEVAVVPGGYFDDEGVVQDSF